MNALNKIGLLVLAVSALTMGGCAGIDTTQAKVQGMDKSGTGIIYGQVMHGWPQSVKTICAKPTSAGDSRCQQQDQYTVVAVNPWSGGGGFAAPLGVQVLVPKSEHVQIDDILKVQIKGNEAAHFEMVASKGNSAGCYWKRGFPSGGGVVCPKYNWDYRTNLAN